MAFLGLLFVAISGCRNQSETNLEDAEPELEISKVDSLATELERQKKLNDSLQEALKTDYYANDYSLFFGKEWEDIEDPEAYITEALKQQTDLIPLEPVLGGTMEFRKVEVISEDWVLAIYDDGHVQGKSIFAYELQDNEEIEFTEIASKLPQ